MWFLIRFWKIKLNILIWVFNIAQKSTRIFYEKLVLKKYTSWLTKCNFFKSECQINKAWAAFCSKSPFFPSNTLEAQVTGLSGQPDVLLIFCHYYDDVTVPWHLCCAARGSQYNLNYNLIASVALSLNEAEKII